MQLAQRIVGKGVTILNPKLSGSAFSTGFFRDDSKTLGIDSGIVLTSGLAKTVGNEKGVDGSAIAPRASYTFTPNSDGYAGDTALTFYSGRQTFDATVLEFDFIPQGDSINVRFVFGSEEYQGVNEGGFICTNYNDVFAFLVEGPGFTGMQNIALVPGTNIPVAINSINNGQPGTTGLALCTAMGPGSPFSNYYVDNRNSPYISYNGFTKILTAKAKVIPCSTYHIRLAIADAFDHSYDSGVFIEASSFSSSLMTLAEQGSFIVDDKPVIVEGCKSSTLRITRSPSEKNVPGTATLKYEGTALNGVDFATLPTVINFAVNETEKIISIVPISDNTVEGDEKLKILLFSGGCASEPSDSIIYTVKDSIIVQTHLQPILCSSEPKILEGPFENGLPNTYQWSTGATTQSISVTAPGLYKLNHSFTGNCSNTISYQVINGDPLFNVPANVSACDKDTVTFNVFNQGASYLWSNSSTASSLKVTTTGNYWVKVTSEKGCTKTANSNVLFKPLPIVDIGEDRFICPYEDVTLQTTYPNTTYQWSTGATTNSIKAQVKGMYWVRGNLNGCTVNDTVLVHHKEMPLLEAGPKKDILAGKSTTLSTPVSSRNATYLWTPNLYTVDNSAATTVASPPKTQTYFLEVTSVDGCKARDSVTIIVWPPLSVPNAFSPNGDGINDRWEIATLGSFQQARIEVYNRYGALVYRSAGYDRAFDGTVNGKPLPTGVYYYIIEPQNGVHHTMTGTLTLIR